MNSSLTEHIISTLSRIEFFSEQGLNFLFKQPNSPSTVKILSIFEIIKAYLRIQKLINVDNLNKIYISDGISTQTSSIAEPKEELFEKLNESFEEITQNNNSNATKERIRSLLGNLKNQKFKNFSFNQNYEETLYRSKKKVGILSSLPIPQEMMKNNTESIIKQKLIFFGEILFVLRPLIYCFSLIFYKTDSFKPYFISLFIDLIRIFLQKNILFYNSEEKKEFDFRKKELLLCYLLRNPFYSLILKSKVIDPILNKLFGRIPILKTIILYFIEIRCCLSLLM